MLKAESIGIHGLGDPAFDIDAAWPTIKRSLTRAYALDRAARLGAVSYVGVVLTYALEAMLMHRAPSVMQLTGAALVVAAGVLTVTAGADAPLTGDRARTTRRSSSSLP